MTGNSYYRDIKNMGHGNILKTIHVTAKDIEITEGIFAPNTMSLKVKIVRKYLEKFKTNYTKVPQQLIDRNKEVTMASDVMFVKMLPYFVIMSIKLRLAAAEHLKNIMEEMLLTSIL